MEVFPSIRLEIAMPEIQNFPWTFLLVFMLLPLVFVGIFLWFATSMFRRAGGFEQDQLGSPDLDGDRPWGPGGEGHQEPAASGRYGSGRSESYQDYDSPRNDQEGWRSFSFGPGLKTMLIIIAISAVISLVFAPRFLPGFILFLPLFWVGGWSRTFKFGPRTSRRSSYDGRERSASRGRR